MEYRRIKIDKEPPKLNEENFPKIQNTQKQKTTTNTHTAASNLNNITVIPESPIEELE